MQITRLVATLLLLSSIASHAQSWRWVEVAGNDETVAFVDVQSLRRTGPKVKVWIKWINSTAVETDTVYPKKTYKSEKNLVIYNCEDRTSIGLQAIRYANVDVSGEVVETITAQESKGGYRELAPETIGESIMNYVCKATSGGKK